MSKLTRRDTLQLGAGALAGATLLRPRWTGAQNYAVKDIAPPQLSIEDGASLRVVRPSKFVAGDERGVQSEHRRNSRRRPASP